MASSKSQRHSAVLLRKRLGPSRFVRVAPRIAFPGIRCLIAKLRLASAETLSMYGRHTTAGLPARTLEKSVKVQDLITLLNECESDAEVLIGYSRTSPCEIEVGVACARFLSHEDDRVPPVDGRGPSDVLLIAGKILRHGAKNVVAARTACFHPPPRTGRRWENATVLCTHRRRVHGRGYECGPVPGNRNRRGARAGALSCQMGANAG
jgi:hypothetical protein